MLITSQYYLRNQQIQDTDSNETNYLSNWRFISIVDFQNYQHKLGFCFQF